MRLIISSCAIYNRLLVCCISTIRILICILLLPLGSLSQPLELSLIFIGMSIHTQFRVHFNSLNVMYKSYGHSWKHYIYSASTRYNTCLPCVIKLSYLGIRMLNPLPILPILTLSSLYACDRVTQYVKPLLRS